MSSAAPLSGDSVNTASSSASSAAAPIGPKIWDLNREHELRVELGEEKEHGIRIKLVNGTAELFGAELAQDREYTFEPSSKFAIFTWYGCQLSVEGSPKVAYVSDDTPMNSYINTSNQINKMRAAAQAQGPQGHGPRVMIVGPTDSGKSTLSRILLNYGVRHQWRPTYVDLDVGQSQITIPGTVAATPIEHPIQPTDMGGITLKSPIVYYFGHVTPTNSIVLYKKLVERLALSVRKRCETIDIAGKSGLIVNTCGWIEGQGYDLILHAAQTFQVDVVLVMGQDKLWSQLKTEPQLQGAAVIKLTRSGGVVERPREYRIKSRNKRIKEYFYGLSNELSPHVKVASWKDVQIFKTGGGVAAPSYVLPLGAKPLLDPDRLIKVEPSVDMKHSVVAVSYAKDSAALLDTNVAGFLHVVDVDPKRHTITFLSPAPGPLPERMMLLGSLKWLD